MKINDLVSLLDYFSTEQKCINFLKPKCCPYCDTLKIYRYNNGKTFKCAECRRKFSVRVGTIFENSPVSLRQWFMAIFLIANDKKGESSIQLGKFVGTTQKTGWFMAHRIIEAIKGAFVNGPMLEGVIQIDESPIGGRLKNKHKDFRSMSLEEKKKYKKKPILLAMLQQSGLIKVIVKKKFNIEEVKKLIIKSVKKGSIIVTDSFRGYRHLKNNYLHKKINHRADQWKTGEYHTNSVEGFFSFAKGTIRGTHHWVSFKHLLRYCQAIAFRYNTRRMSEQNRFLLALSHIGGKRLKYDALTAKETPSRYPFGDGWRN